MPRLERGLRRGAEGALGAPEGVRRGGTEDGLRPVLVPEPWEHKVGWSTNAVEVSGGRFLVGWHGVLRDDLVYRNGLALVNEEGEVLAVSDYAIGAFVADLDDVRARLRRL